MITFSAFVNTVIFSSIAIILLNNVFKDNIKILRLDIRFLLLCVTIILFRLLIPIESPFSNNIPVKNIYPDIYMFLKEPLFTIICYEINILGLLNVIWLVGTVISLRKKIRLYL